MFRVKLFVQDNGNPNDEKKGPNFIFDDVSEPSYVNSMILKMGEQERIYRPTKIRKVYDITGKEIEIYYEVYLKRDG